MGAPDPLDHHPDSLPKKGQGNQSLLVTLPCPRQAVITAPRPRSLSSVGTRIRFGDGDGDVNGDHYDYDFGHGLHSVK
jgi:hypothetical protein